MARKRMERSIRHQKDSVTKEPQHDNSFWRSKITRQWHGSSQTAMSSFTEAGNYHSAGVTEKENEDESCCDPLNDGSTISDCVYDEEDSSRTECNALLSSKVCSNTGIFSSVFDVVRGAVSIWNGPSSRHYYQNNEQPSKTVSAMSQVNKQCLVDTLYLF